jgi:hypothetical protein
MTLCRRTHLIGLRFFFFLFALGGASSTILISPTGNEFSRYQEFSSTHTHPRTTAETKEENLTKTTKKKKKGKKNGGSKRFCHHPDYTTK